MSNKMEHIIFIEERSTDYMAYMEGNKRKWGCGKNRYKAIKELIKTFRECFNKEDIIVIRYKEERIKVKEFMGNE